MTSALLAVALLTGWAASAPAASLQVVTADRPIAAGGPALPLVEPHVAVDPGDPKHLVAAGTEVSYRRARGLLERAQEVMGTPARLEALGGLTPSRRQIAEALPLVDEALRPAPGPFAVQAVIAALHCQATSAEDTDWPQIVRLYDLLERVNPSPIVWLNRAVAIQPAERSPQSIRPGDRRR